MKWLNGTGWLTGEAWAQAPGGPSGGGGMGLISSVLPFVLIFVLFYFLLLRPQMQRQKSLKQMISALKKGDHVVTNGGLMGTVVALNKEVVSLQVAEKVRIKVLRDSIAEVRGEGLEESSSEKGEAG
jgi:preprotein translocase subunit YajC